MKKELREKLEQLNKKLNYGISDEEIVVTLIECGKELKQCNHEKHRWYTTYSVIKKIEDIFVKFTSYENSGDEPMFDTKAWHKMVLDSVVEVEPYKTTIIDYKEIGEKTNE